jgi:hypothetical protein
MAHVSVLLEERMWDLIDTIPYPILIFAAILMLLAPFYPTPHVWEKLIMLKEGTLKKPLDIFDLVFHLVPTIVLLVKFFRSVSK